MKSIKIFLPLRFAHCRELKEIYGKILYDETEVSLKFFAIDDRFGPIGHKIGTINSLQLQEQSDHYFLQLISNISGDLVIDKINGSSGDSENICLIYYDEQKFEYLSRNECDIFPSTFDTDVIDLLKLIKIATATNTSRKLRSESITRPLLAFLNFLAWIFAPFKALFVQTAIYQHFIEWRTCLRDYTFDNYKAWTIVFDMLAGIMVLGIVLYNGDVLDLGKSLMSFTELIVNQLRLLLESLKGSPVGLKLNVLLNNFFLDCFIYHVDLWWTFLVIVSPAIQHLFIPLAVLGFFGISFQLSMLSDLLILVSLHAHCFYIYSAVLYQIEIVGLQALWRVVLGRRKNVLRSRVESYPYYNRQLYIATLLFAALLFLLPTILVYYVVFATLRFGIYCLTYILMVLRKNILKFPIYTLIRWLRGVYVNLDCIELTIAGTQSYKSINNNVTVIHLNPKSCSPWRKCVFENKHQLTSLVSDDEHLTKISQQHTKGHRITISKFLKGLVVGEMMGFIQPEQKFHKKLD